MEDISTEVEVVNMGKYYTHHVTISGLDSEKELLFYDRGFIFVYQSKRYRWNLHS